MQMPQIIEVADGAGDVLRRPVDWRQ